MKLPRTSYGRMATLFVLALLLLTVCVALYLSMPRAVRASDTAADSPEQLRLNHARSLMRLVTTLLISISLILLFVVGAYLLINIGRLITRERVGGKPTQYVDVWGNYRLTDEQISAATSEDRERRDRRAPPGARPEGPDEPGPAGPPDAPDDRPPPPSTPRPPAEP